MRLRSSGSGQSRALRYVGAALLGFAAGAVGSFVHAASLPVGGISVPYGLVLALALSLLVIYRAGRASGHLGGALAAVLGWVLAVLLAASPRSDGDLVLPARWTSYAWLYGGTLLAVLMLATPFRMLERRAADRAAARAAARSADRSGPLAGEPSGDGPLRARR